MPRAAPVTSAHPCCSAIAHPPLDQRRAPGQSGAERGHQDQRAVGDPPLLFGERQGDRDRRRRGVPEAGHVVDDPLERKAERGAAAPAPSASRAAVERSSRSVIRLNRSAPTTSTLRARPDSICPEPSASAETNPLQAAPTSLAPALVAPSAAATTGAALGATASGVIVATRTRSSSVASTP